jgi:hypothetical protein
VQLAAVAVAVTEAAHAHHQLTHCLLAGLLTQAAVEAGLVALLLDYLLALADQALSLFVTHLI